MTIKKYEDGNYDLYGSIQNRGFFAYSGEDGDLFRKQRFGGWRVQIYWGTNLRVQRKVKDWAGRRWITVARFDDIPDNEAALRVFRFIDLWLANPEILEKTYKDDDVSFSDLNKYLGVKPKPHITQLYMRNKLTNPFYRQGRF